MRTIRKREEDLVCIVGLPLENFYAIIEFDHDEDDSHDFACDSSLGG